MVATLSCAAFCISAPVFAQSADAGSSEVSAEATAEAGVGPLPEDFEFVAFPLVAYTPETSVLFAGAGLFFFNVSDHPRARRSDVMVSAAYSLRQQAALKIDSSFYFGDGTVHLGADSLFLDWPSDYFGIGEESVDDGEEYNNQQVETELILDFRLADNFYAGFAYEVGYNSLRIDKDTSLFEPVTPGIDGGLLSGIGIRAKWDTRDTKFATTEGQRFAFEATYFNSLLKSDYDYWKLRLDLRQFFSWSGHTVGFHAVTRITVGDPPFYDMSTIGGDRQLRGVFRARHLDNSMFVVQSEYRTPYLWRLGLAAFAGIGDTFKHFNQLSVGDIKWAGGAGLRVLLKEAERVNLRLDFGVNADDYGIYFGMSEAF